MLRAVDPLRFSVYINVDNYLQCTTIGPEVEFKFVSIALQKSTKHQALSGISLSGQALKWNCRIIRALPVPFYKYQGHYSSNIPPKPL